MLPQVLEDVVHGSTVVELLFELDALTCDLDVTEDTEQRGRQLQDVWVTLKEPLPMEAATRALSLMCFVAVY